MFSLYSEDIVVYVLLQTCLFFHPIHSSDRRTDYDDTWTRLNTIFFFIFKSRVYHQHIIVITSRSKQQQQHMQEQ